MTDIEDQDNGGRLAILIPIPPEAEQIVVRRTTPITQEIDLHNGARLPAELIETIGDKATMEIQEIAEQTITRDRENEIRKALNEALENAVAIIRDDLNRGLQDEAQARIQGDMDRLASAKSYTDAKVGDEARARAQGDTDILEELGEYRLLVEYLIQFIESKFGPFSGAFPLIAEGGHYLVTDDSDYLVVA